MTTATARSWVRSTGALADRRTFLLLLIVVAGAAMSLLSPYFLQVHNLLSMTQYGAVIGLLALGQSLVILGGNGGIDLSVGSMLSLSGVLMGLMTQYGGLNPWLAAAVTLGASVGLGAVNGILVAGLGIPPLIVTLSTLYLYGSLANVLTGGGQLGGFDRAGFPALGQTAILGIPTQVLLVFLPATALCVWVMHRTRSGRVLYQVGTSQLAASLVGIDVRRARFTLYCVSGLLAGLGAIVTNSWLLTARPSAGAGLELQAITIAVLGGIDIFGGRGYLSGTFLGVMLVVVLNSGLQLAGVGGLVQTGLLGAVLVVSVLLNNLMLNRKPLR